MTARVSDTRAVYAPIVMSRRLAQVLVAATSGAVLVLEILAGRLLAPFIGVSLETFTGIIGVVLAGIALGAWLGGEAADRYDASKLIGPAIAAGGIASLLALPIVRTLGPAFGTGMASIVLLTLFAFFVPAVVLSAVSPLVAKLRLTSIDETGAVVGGLSAAGTVGALVGTFLTGFVLVRSVPVTPLVVALGIGLTVSGAVLHWYFTRTFPSVLSGGAAMLAVAMAWVAGPPCDFETGYACINVVVDDDNPSGRSLYLDTARHAYVDLDDPTNLDVRYIRLFTQVIDSVSEGSIRTLHVGGGGFSLPAYLQHTRPGSLDRVLEIDGELVDVAQSELGIRLNTEAGRASGIESVVGDARVTIGEELDDTFDVVVGDAYSGLTLPWHLTTDEFVKEIDRVLAPDGIYVMNLIDGGDNAFARAQLRTVMETFAHGLMIIPSDEPIGARPVNQVAVFSNRPLPRLEIAPADGSLLASSEFDSWVTSGEFLSDDFAPVDQLRAS